jgi:hypothetical protein
MPDLISELEDVVDALEAFETSSQWMLSYRHPGFCSTSFRTCRNGHAGC